MAALLERCGKMFYQVIGTKHSFLFPEKLQKFVTDSVKTQQKSEELS